MIKPQGYEFSIERYDELKAIARQYSEYKSLALRVATGKKTSTPRPDDYAHRIWAIETAAIAAAGDLAEYILLNTTKEQTFEKIAPPCGRRQFYYYRKCFFEELNKRLWI